MAIVWKMGAPNEHPRTLALLYEFVLLLMDVFSGAAPTTLSVYGDTFEFEFKFKMKIAISVE